MLQATLRWLRYALHSAMAARCKPCRGGQLAAARAVQLPLLPVITTPLLLHCCCGRPPTLLTRLTRSVSAAPPLSPSKKTSSPNCRCGIIGSFTGGLQGWSAAMQLGLPGSLLLRLSRQCLILVNLCMFLLLSLCLCFTATSASALHASSNVCRPSLLRTSTQTQPPSQRWPQSWVWSWYRCELESLALWQRPRASSGDMRRLEAYRLCSRAGRISAKLAFTRCCLCTPLPAQVNKWFEKERKKARDAGAAPKRGRPKSGAANDAETAAAIDTAAASTGQENVAPAAQAVGSGAASAPEEEAMDVDAQLPVQATPPQEQQMAAVPEAPVPGAAGAVQAAPAEAEAAPAVSPPPSAAQITPAPAPQPSEAAAGAAARADAAAVPPMAVPGAVGPAPASATAPDAAVAAAKTPASAAPQLLLSADSRHKLQAELQAEADVLRRQGLAPPLRPLPAEPPAERLAFSDTLLAAHVAGQQVPLSQLVAALQPLFKVPDSEAAVEEAVVSR